MAKVWNEEDNQFLRENYMKWNNQELADKFGVSKKSIQGKLRRLGLHRNEVDDLPEKKDAHEPEKKQEKESRSIFMRNRLNVPLESPKLKKTERPPYVARELTERRKRAIRELDSAINIYSQGDIRKAVEEFEFIINTFREEIDIVHKASVLKEFLTAKPSTEDVSDLDHYDAGICLYNQDKVSEALDQFDKAMKENPDDLDATYNVACLKCRAGRVEEAMKLVEWLIERDEKFIETIIYDEDFKNLQDNAYFIEILESRMEEKAD